MGSSAVDTNESASWPTVLHVTHQKAGSQWLRRILYDCAPERVVFAKYGMVQFLQQPVQLGMIYPTLYVTRQEFDRVALPANARRFIVIRDLRDAIASWYFSIKVSHVLDHPLVADMRRTLNALPLEQGLLWLMANPDVQKAAAVQRSWLRSGERLVRYEDLLDRDEEILDEVLLQEFGLPVERNRLREIIRANRFERLTGGRPRGTEDISSHERKGIAGDWRNYFTDPVKAAFETIFGNILVETGYENGNDW
jgi:lipopolysaccharide transport system ATP-binding protein